MAGFLEHAALAARRDVDPSRLRADHASMMALLLDQMVDAARRSRLVATSLCALQDGEEPPIGQPDEQKSDAGHIEAEPRPQVY